MTRVEPLVLVVGHMERGAGALRGEVLDHGDTPVGCLARSLDRGEDAEEPERLTFVFVQCDRAEGCAGGGAHRELLPVFRETSCFTMQQTYSPAWSMSSFAVHCVSSRDGPVLSTEASRRAPGPDPAADHRGRDRAAPDARAGGDNGERDRRARRGGKGDRLPPLSRRAEPRSGVQRPVLQAPPLPRPRPLACRNRPGGTITNRTARG